VKPAPLPGFTPWPETFAARYRERGYWIGEPLDAMLRRHARATPGKTALVDAENRMSYAELDARADRLAAGFARLGLAAQDRAIVQLPNVAEFFEVVFALFRLGAIPVFALPAHRDTELEHFCRIAEARAWIVPDRADGCDYRALAHRVRGRLASPPTVIVAGEAQEFVALDSLYDAQCEPPPRDASEVALMQLSGGSTGVPKLIPRTHDDYLYSVRASADICGLTPESVYLCVLPAGHNFPLSSPGTLGTLFAGGTVVLARTPEPAHCFQLIRDEGVTLTGVVPPIALLWRQATADLPGLLDGVTLQVGGAHLDPAAARGLVKTLGCRLQQVFGMAEGLVNYTRDADSLVYETQGRPISPDDEVRIVDDVDRDLPDGETGHLLTRGPYTLRGYYRAPEHNAAAFTPDGYYRTGDLVRRLPSGHLQVVGRAKAQINRGGEKIAAEELETLLREHPAVADCAVVAVPDAWLGEKTCACIVARDPAAPPRRADFAAHLRQLGIAAYKTPDRVLALAAFPRTGVGKTDRRALAALAATQE
jgi:2,3-dihydroxybenzoate-AMP ligase